MESFTYSDAKKDLITSSIPTLMSITGSFEFGDWTTLSSLIKTQTRYTLHASSLNEYLKANMIPRGLRIQKGLAMFKDDEAFNAKWKAILNKCSVDLMLLIMEQSMARVSTNEVEINELKTKLENETDTDVFNNKFHKIKDEVDALEKNMREFKLQKFRRDARYYNNDNIYNFRSGPRKKPKRVIWADNNFSDIDSAEGDDSTGTSADEGPSYREHRDRAAIALPFSKTFFSIEGTDGKCSGQFVL